MIEDIEKKNQKEEKHLTCPECGKGFQDMRGLTSHARHMHNLEKEELNEKLKIEDDNNWNLIGGIGLTLLTILTLGKMK